MKTGISLKNNHCIRQQRGISPKVYLYVLLYSTVRHNVHDTSTVHPYMTLRIHNYILGAPSRSSEIKIGNTICQIYCIAPAHKQVRGICTIHINCTLWGLVHSVQVETVTGPQQ